mmetsp:Transcript_55713/g.127993  ORF Transcript_55713/g.127993 Transcript_55713/m.127993 type:complete len:80 (+) Transcript_55713:2-241(+)
MVQVLEQHVFLLLFVVVCFLFFPSPHFLLCWNVCMGCRFCVGVLVFFFPSVLCSTVCAGSCVAPALPSFSTHFGCIITL